MGLSLPERTWGRRPKTIRFLGKGERCLTFIAVVICTELVFGFKQLPFTDEDTKALHIGVPCLSSQDLSPVFCDAPRAHTLPLAPAAAHGASVGVSGEPGCVAETKSSACGQRKRWGPPLKPSPESPQGWMQSLLTILFWELLTSPTCGGNNG